MSNQEQDLNKFIRLLVTEKNFVNLSVEVQEQIEQDLLERAETRINAAILAKIPQNKLEEFNALLDNANQDEIQKFCRANVYNLDEVIAEALVRFREIYLSA